MKKYLTMLTIPALVLVSLISGCTDSQGNTQTNNAFVTQSFSQSTRVNNSSFDHPCIIKGNISLSGERIYHVPGGQYYDRTDINLPAGERWFCTEGEAEVAGWRQSKR